MCRPLNAWLLLTAPRFAKNPIHILRECCSMVHCNHWGSKNALFLSTNYRRFNFYTLYTLARYVLASHKYLFVCEAYMGYMTHMCVVVA